MARQKEKTKSTNKQKPMHGKRKKHKVINWHDYNEALKQRGNVEIWIEKGLAEGWVEIPGEGRRKLGRQKKYSDQAITTTLQFGAVFHQKLRQTEGFVPSGISDDESGIASAGFYHALSTGEKCARSHSEGE
jgi:hypothetical protein